MILNVKKQTQMLINGFMSTAIIYSACELGVFDSIKREKNKLNLLAEDLNVDPVYLIKILRPLEQYRIIRCENDVYSLTDMGEYLAEDSEDSLKDYTLFCGRECIKVWMKMYDSMVERKAPMELLGEDELFNNLENDENRFSTFNKMMSSVSKQLDLEALFIILESKFACIDIVDVGGGTGTIIKKFLSYYPQARGTILDLNQAKDAAEAGLLKDGFSTRCVFKEADFFKALQVTGDIFVLSRVLHDWDDEKSELILKNVKDAMGDDSKLVIIDEIILDSNNPACIKGYICDIQMWVFCNGKERTKAEFEVLLKKAGLQIDDIINIDNGTSAIICKKENVTAYEFGEI